MCNFVETSPVLRGKYLHYRKRSSPMRPAGVYQLHEMQPTDLWGAEQPTSKIVVIGSPDHTVIEKGLTTRLIKLN